MSEQVTITITIEEYNELTRDFLILNALYAMGVEEWDYFEAALELVKEEY